MYSSAVKTPFISSQELRPSNSHIISTILFNRNGSTIHGIFVPQKTHFRWTH